jgi:hypothetical protein
MESRTRKRDGNISFSRVLYTFQNRFGQTKNKMATITNENPIEKRDNKNLETKNKKFYGIPFPKIYLQVLRVSCPFCNKRGRAKVYKNLWQLRMHFSSNHTDDQFTQGCKNTIGELVDYVTLEQSLTERGVLR